MDESLLEGCRCAKKEVFAELALIASVQVDLVERARHSGQRTRRLCRSIGGVTESIAILLLYTLPALQIRHLLFTSAWNVTSHNRHSLILLHLPFFRVR